MRNPTSRNHLLRNPKLCFLILGVVRLGVPVNELGTCFVEGYPNFLKEAINQTVKVAIKILEFRVWSLIRV